MSSVHESLARYRKATAIADTLIATYATLEDPPLPLVEVARGMNQEQRDRAATVAGQRSPSEETWQLTCAMIEKRTRNIARNPDEAA